MTTRPTVRRIAPLITAAILLSACGSTANGSPSMVASTAPATPSAAATASTGPGTSATPLPTFHLTPEPTLPAPSAPPVVAAGWPYSTPGDVTDVLFAPDGRVVAVETGGHPGGRIVALAADGTLLDGWPWAPAASGNSVIMRAALGPGGSVYVAVRSGSGEPLGFAWTLHRISTSGQELPGFPVLLPSAPSVSNCSLDVSGDGIAFVTCQDEGTATSRAATAVMAIHPDGSSSAGWPVRLGGGSETAGFRPDGALVIRTPRLAATTITVIDGDGRVQPGWPQAIPGYDTAAVDGIGRVWVTSRTWTEGQCGPATGTSYTALGPDGRRVTGWPVALAGWASDPELGTDGRMYITTGSDRVVAYSASGTVLPGWPARGVGVTVACFDGSQPVSAGEDGVVVVGDDRATLVAPTGRVATGWPVTLPYEVATTCPQCTPGPSRPIDPVVGERAIYVAVDDHVTQRIVAIDRKGSMPAAWQRSLGTGNGQLSWLRMAPTGRVWAAVARAQGSEQASTTIYLVAQDSVVGG